MVVTEFGIVKDPVRSVQPVNAPTPIVITVFGIVNIIAKTNCTINQFKLYN